MNKIKIEFFWEKYDDQSMYPRLKSDSVFCLDYDCLNLLFSDLDNDDDISRLERDMQSGKFVWWSNVSRAECDDGKQVKLYTPESYNDEYAEVGLSTLQLILTDWRTFLKEKKPFTQSY